MHLVFGRMDSFKNDILGVTLNFHPLTCSFPSDFLMGGGNLKHSISNIYARHRTAAASRSAFVPDNNQLINIIMQKTIKLYETPDMKVFDMHAEGVMCQSPYGEVDSAANGYDEQYDLGEI